jgi:hypothetical protein
MRDSTNLALDQNWRRNTPAAPASLYTESPADPSIARVNSARVADHRSPYQQRAAKFASVIPSRFVCIVRHHSVFWISASRVRPLRANHFLNLIENRRMISRKRKRQIWNRREGASTSFLLRKHSFAENSSRNRGVLCRRRAYFRSPKPLRFNRAFTFSGNPSFAD